MKIRVADILFAEFMQCEFVIVELRAVEFVIYDH